MIKASDIRPGMTLELTDTCDDLEHGQRVIVLNHAWFTSRSAYVLEVENNGEKTTFWLDRDDDFPAVEV